MPPRADPNAAPEPPPPQKKRQKRQKRQNLHGGDRGAEEHDLNPLPEAHAAAGMREWCADGQVSDVLGLEGEEDHEGQHHRLGTMHPANEGRRRGGRAFKDCMPQMLGH